MSYSINVALNGRHYFATTERSLQTSEQAAKMLVDFVKRFPAQDGFKVSISYNPGISYHLDNIEANDIVDPDKLQKHIASLGKRS